MNKIFTTLVLLCLGFASFQVSAQAPRTILFEEFTSATCPPCASTNPIFNNFLKQFGSRTINMAFQCNIPVTGDPMYASNTSEVGTRMTYYGINSAPNCRMDGKVVGDQNSTHPLAVSATTVNNRLAVESPIEISVDHIVLLGTNGAKDSMDITVIIKNVSASDFSNANYVLQTSIIEELIRFPKQAATNGETDFHVVMRKMLPSATGTKITDVITPGSTKEIKFRAAVPTYIYSYNEIGVVAFLQNNSGKEIIQTGISHPKPVNGVYYDLAVTSGKIINKVDNCDNTAAFEVEVENLSTGTDTIKTIDFIPVVGGASKAKSTWTGVLLPGQKITHKIGNQTLAIGKSTINVAIDKINAGAIKDLNVVNNFDEQVATITFNSNVSGTSIAQTFEAPVGSGAPANTFFLNEGLRIFKIDSSFSKYNGADPPFGIGGFGKSRYSACFYFFDQGVAGASSSIIFDKIDLTNSKSTKLKWSYAYTTNDDSNTDKFEVFVSKNCGADWESVYQNEGVAMKSCDPAPENFHYPGVFIPMAENWKIESVDLSSYDGTPELMIRFKGTAGNGQGYYLDDVNVNSAVATNDPGILRSLSVSPNPAVDYFVVKVNTEENASAVINLFDLNGKNVHSLKSNLIAGLNEIKMNVDQTPGLYMVEVKTDKGVRTEKINILK